MEFGQIQLSGFLCDCSSIFGPVFYMKLKSKSM